MMEHLTFDQLCDLADDALVGADAVAARAHLDACAECAAQYAALTQLHAEASALPRAIEPPADLWADVRASIAPRRATFAPRTWTVRHLAAAAVIAAIGSSAITVVALRRDGARVDTASTVAVAQPVAPAIVALPAALASEENSYTRSVRVLQATLDERRDSLAPSTVETVERSLRVADSAIAEARDALAHDPANVALARIFASNYARKIDLLRRATELAPRT